MASNPAKAIIASEDYQLFIKQRSRLSWLCFSLAVSVVFIFDLLSTHFPAIVSATISSNSVITVGVVLVYLILIFIVALALYYTHWVNREFIKITSSHLIKS